MTSGIRQDREPTAPYRHALNAWVSPLATCALPKGVCYLLTYLRVAASGGSAQRGAGRRVARVWLPGAGRIVSRDSTFVCGARHSVQNRVVEKWGLCVNPERIPSHTPLGLKGARL